MAEQFMGRIPQEEWIDVGFNVTRPNDPLDSIIGDVRTDNIMAAWQSIASEYQIPIMAYYHAFDTEARKTFDVPIDTHHIEKGLIKVKKNTSERMRELKKMGVPEIQLPDYITNDGIRLADQVVTRTKVAKAEMMATGQITIKENNLDLPVKYGVPDDQIDSTGKFDLGVDADIPGQLQDLVDKASEKGVTLSGMLTSRAIITKMRKNKAIQSSINGALMSGMLVGRTALMSYLEEEFGLSNILTDDLTYAVEDGFDEDSGRPKVKQHRYFPKDIMSFFSANPAGRVGTGLWGDPPELDLRLASVTNAGGDKPFVYVTQWEEPDPAVLWTKASGLFIPLLYNPYGLWIAKEKAGE